MKRLAYLFLTATLMTPVAAHSEARTPTEDEMAVMDLIYLERHCGAAVNAEWSGRMLYKAHPKKRERDEWVEFITDSLDRNVAKLDTPKKQQFCRELKGKWMDFID